MPVFAPNWEIQKHGDCKKIMAEGMAEGFAEIEIEPEEGYELIESTE